MKIPLLAMVLVLVCDLQALETNVKNPEKLTGEWHTVALASTDPSRIMRGGSLEIFVQYVMLENGNLKGIFLKGEKDKCTKFDVTSYVRDGQLKVDYDGHNDVPLLTAKAHYLMAVLINHKDGKITTWAELFGRTPDLSDEVKEKFAKVCEDYGIQRDQIRDLSKEERCNHLRTAIWY